MNRERASININTVVCPDPPSEFLRLPEEQQYALVEWIVGRFVPRSGKANPKSDSYALKHIFEANKKGFYVTNGQFKGAMLQAGFVPSNPKAKNWTFPLGPAFRCPYELTRPGGVIVQCWHEPDPYTGICNYHRSRKLYGYPARYFGDVTRTDDLSYSNPDDWGTP